MARITFEGNFCDISMCRENPCPYNGMCSQRQTWERLKEYEDTGFDPEEIADFMKRWEQTVEIGGMLKKYCIDHIRDLLHAEQDGRLVVLDEKTALCMCAGARAIENNKRLFGASYCYDVFGKRGGPKEISYYEASNHLRDVAEPVLDREEAEAALAQEGGKDHA